MTQKLYNKQIVLQTNYITSKSYNPQII